MDLKSLKLIIENSHDWISAEEITFGWSGEQKYIITNNAFQKYLLRILSIEQYNEQKEGIGFLKHCKTVVENIPAVIDQGYTMDKTHYYLLLDYINGDNGMLCISKYSSEDQYRLGYQMGENISAIHGLSESKIYPDKSNAYRYKINKYIEYYKSHKFQFAFLNGIEEILEEFVLQISTRPMIMLHNDFHLGNMVINGDNVSLIDFNRACLGDNIREFDCVAWTVTHSIPFAVGIFDAYLRDKDINSFFKFWRGYLAIWQIQMLYFIDGQDDEEKKIVVDLIKLSNSWFDKSKTIPNWYLNNSKIIN